MIRTGTMVHSPQARARPGELAGVTGKHPRSAAELEQSFREGFHQAAARRSGWRRSSSSSIR